LIELVLRIAFSLLVVLGLMWGLAKLARRPLTGNRGGGVLSVLNRQQLGRNSSVTVVRVADRALILGVTDTQVTILGETDLEAFEHQPHAAERRDAVQVDAVQAGTVQADTVPVDAAGLPVAYEDHLAIGIEHVPGRLDGSLLSPRTWSSTLDFLRERTSRR
jgi:flagellar protein FliO/FliZ